MSTKGAYPWAEKQTQYAKMTLAELSFARRDAYEAAKAMRGVDPVAEGWYSDDISTIALEQARRIKHPERYRDIEEPELTIEELFAAEV